MSLLDDFHKAEKALFDHVGFDPKLASLPIEDSAGLFWMVEGDMVFYADTIEAWIADAETPITAKLAWREAYRFSRNSALFDAFAGEFGLTPEQVDDLFVLAQSKVV